MGAPSPLERWTPHLLQVARELLRTTGPRDRLERNELKIVARGVQRLSLGLTRERGLVGERYLDEPALLAAYLLFYWPVSYAQTRSILGELPRLSGPVLDLGSGPSPASFAALDFGATRALAADRSRASLKLASRLGTLARLNFTTQAWSPAEQGGRLPDGRYQLIVVQHLLNELWTGPDWLDQRVVLCRNLLGKLTPGGTLLLIDPALRETSRELLQVRDRLVDDGFAIRAPCLYRGHCQALERPSDWCHGERDWETPPFVLELARAAGLHKERLKMSYLAIAPPGESWAQPPPGRVLRIVSEPLRGKGRRRYMACGPEGRMGLALQEKHVGDSNRHFMELERGEVVRIDGAEPKGDGLGLGAASIVERLAGPGEPVR